MSLNESKQPILELKELRKKYDDRYVLQGIDLEAYEGQIIGYIGPNGAGKSTTVKIMLGLVEDFTGEVRLFGRSILDGDQDYKRRIGYVPEMTDLYDSLTAAEYLTFIGELYGLSDEDADDKAARLMELFGLREAYHSRISSYSKGMRQKVMLISSLLHDPDLLFLDEPLSGLDANSVMMFKEIMSQLAANGKTIFYSSHIMEVVEKISDRIVLIDEGRVVADGSFETLKEQSSEGSLEQIFNRLTGFDEYKSLAETFVSVVRSR